MAGTSTFHEECDLGGANPMFNYVYPTGWNSDAADIYYHACDTNCKKRGTVIGVDYHLWKCDDVTPRTSDTYRTPLARSVCHFLCGNKWLDTDQFEPCDRLD